MKLLFENWRQYLNEDLLIEGRFDDALAVAQNLKKMAKVKRVQDVYKIMSDYEKESIKNGMGRAINYLANEDPSGNNEYLMWSARFLRAGIGRALQKFSATWGTSPLSWTDDEGGAENIEFYRERPVELATRLLPILKTYHKLKERNLIKKDIMEYDPVNEAGELRNDVNNIEKELIDKERLEKVDPSEYEEIENTEDYKLTRAFSEDASCKLGRGGGWCISRTKAENWFDRYTQEGKTFYFLTLKHLAEKDPNKSIVLQWDSNTQSEGEEPESVWDAPNTDIGTYGLRDAIQSNIMTKLAVHPELNKTSHNKEKLKRIKGLEDREEAAGQLQTLAQKVAENIHHASANPIPGNMEEIKKSLKAWKEKQKPGEEDFTSDEMKMLLSNHTALNYARLLGLAERGYPIQGGGDVLGAFKEYVEMQYKGLIQDAAIHFTEHPAGPGAPGIDAYYEVYENWHTSYEEIGLTEPEEVDEGRFNYEAHWAIDSTEPWLEEKFKIVDNVDTDDFLGAVEKALDAMGLYPDHSESEYGGTRAFFQFYPDGSGWGGDEFGSPDAYDNFLRRMSDYDDKLASDEFQEYIGEALMEAGLTTGGVTEFAEQLEELGLENVEVGIEGTELQIVLPIEPTLARPRDISDKYFDEIIEAMGSQGPWTAQAYSQQTTDAALAKIEQGIKDTYEEYYNQAALPGLEADLNKEPPEALPIIAMTFIPKPGRIKQLKVTSGLHSDPPMKSKAAAGINIPYPHNFILYITNQDYWEELGLHEEELEATKEFVQWIDKEEVIENITAILQAALNDTVLTFMKEHPPKPEEPKPSEVIPPDYKIEPKFTQQRAEQRLQEVYKQWAKMIK